MQYHFVVFYDDEREAWFYDGEQTGIAFPDGEIWNEPEGEFLAAYHDATPAEVTHTHEEAAIVLADTLSLYAGKVKL